MFNKLLKYIKNDEHLISFSKDYLHIYNFKQILNISDNNIEILLDNKRVNINGTDFLVVKMENKELLFKGNTINIEIK